MNAHSPILLDGARLQAAPARFPRDRAMWIDGRDDEGRGGEFDRSSPAHGALATRAPRGGKTPRIVFADADREAALDARAFGAYFNAGGRRDGRGVRAGTVWLDTLMDGTPELPFIACGQSGPGRELGLGAIADYTEENTFHAHGSHRTN